MYDFPSFDAVQLDSIYKFESPFQINIMTAKKYLQTNPNEAFYSSLMKQQTDIDRDIANVQIKQRIETILCKMGELSPQQKQQWRQINLTKIRQLYSRLREREFTGNSKILRECLRVFAMVCSSVGIEYNIKQYEQMTKEIYLAIYDKKIMVRLVKAGFSTSEMEILEYEEPINRTWRFFCCCSIP